MNLPPMILASASPRRSDLLRQMELEFSVLPAKTDEASFEHLTPHELCQLNAYRKARAVSKAHPDDLVLGADTEVCLGPTIFGKPKNKAQAEEMLGRLQGKTHEVVTGVCLVHLRTHRQRLFAVSTLVTFKSLSKKQIRDYLQAINPLDKAGAYAIQEKGDELVEKIDGSFTNVVGLPVERLEEELPKFEQ